MDWDKVDWSKFSPQEAHRMRHRMIEEKHKGHDLMHAEMILILFSSIIVAQILLFTWRQKRPRYMPTRPLHRDQTHCIVCVEQGLQLSVVNITGFYFANAQILSDSYTIWSVGDSTGDQPLPPVLEDGVGVDDILGNHNLRHA